MGVGYQVSPLHRLLHLNMAELKQRPIVKGESAFLDAFADAMGLKTIAEGPWHFQSPKVESILAWRQALASKYNDQLGEELTWDERSTFATSEDVATRGDAMFHFVAAVLDQRGQAALGDLVRRNYPPPDDEMDAAFTEADRRGPSGRFPQLLLGARIWLPFERNLVIDEPDWDGKPDLYGSLFRFVDEVAAVRAGIAVADPLVVGSTEWEDPPEQILASAWQSSVTILRLATLATGKRLPLLTTG